MTTEFTDPQSELGPVPANEQGQSQGHRRRRRRRKNKNRQAGTVPAQPALQAQQPQAEIPAQPQRPPVKHKTASHHQGGHPH